MITSMSNMSTDELLEVYNDPGAPQVKKDLAMDEVIRRNDRLIISTINKYFSSYKRRHIEDMWQEGRRAMFENAPRYDKTKSEFSTFIVPYIVDAIKLYLCEYHGISTHYSAQLKKEKRAVEALQARGILNPSYAEIAQEMGVGVEAVRRTHEMNHRLNPISIEGDDKDICSPYSSAPEQMYERQETNEALEKAISDLPDIERKIIYLKFFSDPSGKVMTLTDIAKRIGIPFSETRQHYNLALCRMKNSKHLSDFTSTASQREMEEYNNSIGITLMIPDEAVTSNIEIALQFGDDDSSDDVPSVAI